MPAHPSDSEQGHGEALAHHDTDHQRQLLTYLAVTAGLAALLVVVLLMM